MSNSSIAEMYFIGAMMLLILVICAASCFFFFRQMQREKNAVRKAKDSSPQKETTEKNFVAK